MTKVAESIHLKPKWMTEEQEVVVVVVNELRKSKWV